MTDDFNPANMSGFTQYLFTVLGRFRDVAIDNHIQGGSLDDLTAHETGLVPGDYLLNHYQKPVVFSVFSDYSGSPTTIAHDTDTFTIDVAVFDWDFDLSYGMENAIRLTAKVVDNVEANRTLESSPGAGDPIAEDVQWSTLEPDFEFSDSQDMVLNWASVSFEIQTRRQRPT